MNGSTSSKWNPEELQILVREAREILGRNDLGRSTKPAPELYPHQWNWDSGFIAVGISHYNQSRAQEELNSLFEAQWDNGMVPQIVFNTDELGDYFPEPDFWRADRSPNYPDHAETSGITMPPVHGMAVEHIMKNAEDRGKLDDWLDTIYPKLVRSHRYFYEQRDPENEGLTYIRHPWESGIDNSPAWDPVLSTIDRDSIEIPEYERRDLDHDIPAEQRPDSSDYDRYVHLIDIFRTHDYNETAIRSDCPFLVQDPLFNSILCRSTEAVVNIGKYLERDTTSMQTRLRQTRRAIREKLWSDEYNMFFPYDLNQQELIEVPTAMSFLPLITEAPTDRQVDQLYKQLESRSFCPMHSSECVSIPNYDMEGEQFDADNYWRGPVWINMNWMLMNGLKRHGYTKKSNSVRADIIDLVKQWGFHEYFDPFARKGYGTDAFSWTAALFIDTVHTLPTMNSRE